MKSVASLSIAYTNVVGDSIVAAGTIAYLGAFTSEFRHMLVHDWLTTLRDTTVPHTDGTNVCSTLANPVEVRTRACLLLLGECPHEGVLAAFGGMSREYPGARDSCPSLHAVTSASSPPPLSPVSPTNHLP